ncbi:MAG TPA: APC family permease [Bryobacteraceae bacterium]|jgi:amino acid transporter|nr:APC family permease [Bryobacteraceae bacterium]
MTNGVSSEAPAAPEPHLKKALGVWDLTWLSVVAIANLNVVPVIAAAGPTTIWLWLAAIAFFFVPQGIGVIALSRRFPGEGGIYVWTKAMFGDLHGFLCGWCYWTANMFFIPTLLFYLLGLVSYVGGPAAARLTENPVFFGTLTIGLLWLTAFANIRGVGLGKWVNNIGGLGTLAAALALIVLGAIVVAKFGISLPAGAFRLQKLDLGAFSTFGLVCFGLVGLELGCVMGDEIRDPLRSVPRGVLYGGVLSAIQYVGASLALLLAVPQSDMKVLQGVLQGVDKMTIRLNMSWTLLPLAILVGISTIGATSAWLSGSARILFVSGIDQYLPKVFGKLHPKHDTPYIAIIGIAVLSSCLIMMSFAGSTTVREAYVTLLDLSVAIQMISYLYVYSCLIKLVFGKIGATVGSRVAVGFAAVAGLATTALGFIVAFIPSHQVDSVWRFEIKMVLSSVIFLGFAAALFAYRSRHRTTVETLVVEA